MDENAKIHELLSSFEEVRDKIVEAKKLAEQEEGGWKSPNVSSLIKQLLAKLDKIALDVEKSELSSSWRGKLNTVLSRKRTQVDELLAKVGL